MTLADIWRKVTLADIWRERIPCIIHTSTQEEADMLFKVVDSYDHNGTTWASLWDIYKKKTCYRANSGKVIAYGCMDDYIENGEKVIEFSDLVATGGYCDLIATGGYCNGFRGGKIPTPSKPVSIVDQLDSLADAWSRLGCTSFQMATDVIDKILKKSEEKKLKFTFYVKEGTRVDKTCNKLIPAMTTTVETNSYSRTAPVGTATCDKADYDMRQGVLEALANMCCDGDFDKVFNKAVKRNELADKKKRTCKYCGKVFDTIEEREAEEAWHVERKKARRERYLLRKRAKEIAFEEQAQKMAKEIMNEKK